MDGATGVGRGTAATEGARAVKRGSDPERLDLPGTIARMKAAAAAHTPAPVKAPTPEQLTWARESRLQRTGVPRKYWAAEWDKVDGDLLVAAKRWLRGLREHVETGTNLWLGGAVGTGKSMALALIAEEASAELGSDAVRYVFAAELFDRLVRAADLRDMCSLWVEPAVLLIDDLGRQHDAAWPMSRFTTVVEKRYADLRPTVVASNLSPKRLREANEAWEPICSRLVESMVGTWQAGPDRRREGQEEHV